MPQVYRVENASTKATPEKGFAFNFSGLTHDLASLALNLNVSAAIPAGYAAAVGSTETNLPCCPRF